MNALATSYLADRYNLEELPDDALLAGARRLVAGANHTLAALLAHLAEVEARGIHRIRACSSLYTYCVHELRLSEDAAFRRAKAARWCRKFPALYDAVARGELHLTGLLMLGPHLSDENLADVLARAKHRTKRELQKLVSEIDPLPAVPARIEPLGPSLIASPRNPTWSEFVASFNPVRELTPGERPADWLVGAGDAEGCDAGGAETVREDAAVGSDGESAVGAADTAQAPAPARPQRYKVQFTATQEYVDLLERARDLLSHALPDRSIEAVHLRALRELVAALEKKKCAATDKPRQRGTRDSAPPNDDPRQRGTRRETSALDNAARQRGTCGPQRESALPRRRDNNLETADTLDPRQRGTIPAAVRRAVWERDASRCTFVDERGQRCRETALLELHHDVPFARGGPATADNLYLRCHAHNALAAEQDFGPGFMAWIRPAAPDG